MEAIRSKGCLLKVKLREKEEHIAILQQKCQGCPRSRKQANREQQPGCHVVEARTKEVLIMTANKRKEVARHQRHFSNMEQQMEAWRAIETATLRIQALG
jgi:hypothetical protein